MMPPTRKARMHEWRQCMGGNAALPDRANMSVGKRHGLLGYEMSDVMHNVIVWTRVPMILMMMTCPKIVLGCVI
jgi:hypothetical protein